MNLTDAVLIIIAIMLFGVMFQLVLLGGKLDKWGSAMFWEIKRGNDK